MLLRDGSVALKWASVIVPPGLPDIKTEDFYETGSVGKISEVTEVDVMVLWRHDVENGARRTNPMHLVAFQEVNDTVDTNTKLPSQNDDPVSVTAAANNSGGSQSFLPSLSCHSSSPSFLSPLLTRITEALQTTSEQNSSSDATVDDAHSSAFPGAAFAQISSIQHQLNLHNVSDEASTKLLSRYLNEFLPELLPVVLKSYHTKQVEEDGTLDAALIHATLIVDCVLRGIIDFLLKVVEARLHTAEALQAGCLLHQLLSNKNALFMDYEYLAQLRSACKNPGLLPMSWFKPSSSFFKGNHDTAHASGAGSGSSFNLHKTDHSLLDGDAKVSSFPAEDQVTSQVELFQRGLPGFSSSFAGDQSNSTSTQCSAIPTSSATAASVEGITSDVSWRYNVRKGDLLQYQGNTVTVSSIGDIIADESSATLTFFIELNSNKWIDTGDSELQQLTQQKYKSESESPGVTSNAVNDASGSRHTLTASESQCKNNVSHDAMGANSFAKVTLSHGQSNSAWRSELIRGSRVFFDEKNQLSGTKHAAVVIHVSSCKSLKDARMIIAKNPTSISSNSNAIDKTGSCKSTVASASTEAECDRVKNYSKIVCEGSTLPINNENDFVFLSIEQMYNLLTKKSSVDTSKLSNIQSESSHDLLTLMCVDSFGQCFVCVPRSSSRLLPLTDPSVNFLQFGNNISGGDSNAFAKCPNAAISIDAILMFDDTIIKTPHGSKVSNLPVFKKMRTEVAPFDEQSKSTRQIQTDFSYLVERKSVSLNSYHRDLLHHFHMRGGFRLLLCMLQHCGPQHVQTTNSFNINGSGKSSDPENPCSTFLTSCSTSVTDKKCVSYLCCAGDDVWDFDDFSCRQKEQPLKYNAKKASHSGANQKNSRLTLSFLTSHLTFLSDLAPFLRCGSLHDVQSMKQNIKKLQVRLADTNWKSLTTTAAIIADNKIANVGPDNQNTGTVPPNPTTSVSTSVSPAQITQSNRRHVDLVNCFHFGNPTSNKQGSPPNSMKSTNEQENEAVYHLGNNWEHICQYERALVASTAASVVNEQLQVALQAPSLDENISVVVNALIFHLPDAEFGKLNKSMFSKLMYAITKLLARSMMITSTRPDPISSRVEISKAAEDQMNGCSSSLCLHTAVVPPAHLVYRASERLELHLVKRCLSNYFLTCRRTGVELLIELFELAKVHTLNKMRFTYAPQFEYGAPSASMLFQFDELHYPASAKWLNIGRLVKWLETNDIISTITCGENSHKSLIALLTPLISQIVDTSYMTQSLRATLWRALLLNDDVESIAELRILIQSSSFSSNSSTLSLPSINKDGGLDMQTTDNLDALHKKDSAEHLALAGQYLIGVLTLSQVNVNDDNFEGKKCASRNKVNEMNNTNSSTSTVPETIPSMPYHKIESPDRAVDNILYVIAALVDTTLAGNVKSDGNNIACNALKMLLDAHFLSSQCPGFPHEVDGIKGNTVLKTAIPLSQQKAVSNTLLDVVTKLALNPRARKILFGRCIRTMTKSHHSSAKCMRLLRRCLQHAVPPPSSPVSGPFDGLPAGTMPVRMESNFAELEANDKVKHALSAIIEQLDCDHALLQNILDGLTNNPFPVDVGDVTDNFSNDVDIQAKQEDLRTHFDFLGFILSRSSLVLSFESVVKLWRVFVNPTTKCSLSGLENSASTVPDSKVKPNKSVSLHPTLACLRSTLFFALINRASKLPTQHKIDYRYSSVPPRQLGMIMEDATLRLLFKKYLCKKEFTRHSSPAGFECLKRLFLYVYSRHQPQLQGLCHEAVVSPQTALAADNIPRIKASAQNIDIGSEGTNENPESSTSALNVIWHVVLANKNSETVTRALSFLQDLSNGVGEGKIIGGISWREASFRICHKLLSQVVKFVLQLKDQPKAQKLQQALENHTEILELASRAADFIDLFAPTNDNAVCVQKNVSGILEQDMCSSKTDFALSKTLADFIHRQAIAKKNATSINKTKMGVPSVCESWIFGRFGTDKSNNDRNVSSDKNEQKQLLMHLQIIAVCLKFCSLHSSICTSDHLCVVVAECVLDATIQCKTHEEKNGTLQTTHDWMRLHIFFLHALQNQVAGYVQKSAMEPNLASMSILNRVCRLYCELMMSPIIGECRRKVDEITIISQKTRQITSDTKDMPVKSQSYDSQILRQLPHSWHMRLIIADALVFLQTKFFELAKTTVPNLETELQSPLTSLLSVAPKYPVLCPYLASSSKIVLERGMVLHFYLITLIRVGSSGKHCYKVLHKNAKEEMQRNTIHLLKLCSNVLRYHAHAHQKASFVPGYITVGVTRWLCQCLNLHSYTEVHSSKMNIGTNTNFKSDRNASVIDKHALSEINVVTSTAKQDVADLLTVLEFVNKRHIATTNGNISLTPHTAAVHQAAALCGAVQFLTFCVKVNEQTMPPMDWSIFDDIFTDVTAQRHSKTSLSLSSSYIAPQQTCCTLLNFICEIMFKNQCHTPQDIDNSLESNSKSNDTKNHNNINIESNSAKIIESNRNSNADADNISLQSNATLQSLPGRLRTYKERLAINGRHEPVSCCLWNFLDATLAGPFTTISPLLPLIRSWEYMLLQGLTHYRYYSLSQEGFGSGPKTKELGHSCGLQNMGSTCYANAILQLLFVNETFRSTILDTNFDQISRKRLKSIENDHLHHKSKTNENKIPPNSVDDEKFSKAGTKIRSDTIETDFHCNSTDVNSDQFNESIAMLKQLQTLFCFMESSDRESVSPHQYLESFRDEAGRPPNPGSQEDAVLFAGRLIDQLETVIPRSTCTSIFSSNVRSAFSAWIGDECIAHHTRIEKDNFLRIKIDASTSNGSSIEASLQQMFGPQHAVPYLHRWDGILKKRQVDSSAVTSYKRDVITTLPDTLLLQLKRFQYIGGSTVKLGDRMTFPMILDMRPYTAAARTGSSHMHKTKKSQNTDLYDLLGVVIHAGTATSGHYWAIVKCEGHWIECNDTNVSVFDEQKIASLCFGGKLEPSHTNFKSTSVPSSNNIHASTCKSKISTSDMATASADEQIALEQALALSMQEHSSEAPGRGGAISTTQQASSFPLASTTFTPSTSKIVQSDSDALAMAMQAFLASYTPNTSLTSASKSVQTSTNAYMLMYKRRCDSTMRNRRQFDSCRAMMHHKIYASSKIHRFPGLFSPAIAQLSCVEKAQLIIEWDNANRQQFNNVSNPRLCSLMLGVGHLLLNKGSAYDGHNTLDDIFECALLRCSIRFFFKAFVFTSAKHCHDMILIVERLVEKIRQYAGCIHVVDRIVRESLMWLIDELLLSNSNIHSRGTFGLHPHKHQNHSGKVSSESLACFGHTYNQYWTFEVNQGWGVYNGSQGNSNLDSLRCAILENKDDEIREAACQMLCILLELDHEAAQRYCHKTSHFQMNSKCQRSWFLIRTHDWLSLGPSNRNMTDANTLNAHGDICYSKFDREKALIKALAFHEIVSGKPIETSHTNIKRWIGRSLWDVCNEDNTSLGSKKDGAVGRGLEKDVLIPSEDTIIEPQVDSCVEFEENRENRITQRESDTSVGNALQEESDEMDEEAQLNLALSLSVAGDASPPVSPPKRIKNNYNRGSDASNFEPRDSLKKNHTYRTQHVPPLFIVVLDLLMSPTTLGLALQHPTKANQFLRCVLHLTTLNQTLSMNTAQIKRPNPTSHSQQPDQPTKGCTNNKARPKSHVCGVPTLLSACARLVACANGFLACCTELLLQNVARGTDIDHFLSILAPDGEGAGLPPNAVSRGGADIVKTGHAKGISGASLRFSPGYPAQNPLVSLMYQANFKTKVPWCSLLHLTHGLIADNVLWWRLLGLYQQYQIKALKVETLPLHLTQLGGQCSLHVRVIKACSPRIHKFLTQKILHNSLAEKLAMLDDTEAINDIIGIMTVICKDWEDFWIQAINILCNTFVRKRMHANRYIAAVRALVEHAYPCMVPNKGEQPSIGPKTLKKSNNQEYDDCDNENVSTNIVTDIVSPTILEWKHKLGNALATWCNTLAGHARTIWGGSAFAASESATVRWSCPICTFNAIGAKCEICDTSRPDSSARPTDHKKLQSCRWLFEVVETFSEWIRDSQTLMQLMSTHRKAFAWMLPFAQNFLQLQEEVLLKTLQNLSPKTNHTITDNNAPFPDFIPSTGVEENDAPAFQIPPGDNDLPANPNNQDVMEDLPPLEHPVLNLNSLSTEVPLSTPAQLQKENQTLAFLKNFIGDVKVDAVAPISCHIGNESILEPD